MRQLKRTLILLAFFALPAAAQADTESATTGPSYSYCRHTRTDEKLLSIEINLMGTTDSDPREIERRTVTLKEAWKLPIGTRKVEFRAADRPMKLSGLRLSCTFQQPNPKLRPTTSQETQPWIEAEWIAVKAGDPLTLNLVIQEPSPGLRTVVIGGIK